MDRFIAARDAYSISVFFNLKSSMDRFIELDSDFENSAVNDLKSSMDRFIVLRHTKIKEVSQI